MEKGVLVVLGGLAVLGTIGIVYVASYIEALTELGRTDREAAAALFRTRVLPVLWVVGVFSLAAGGLLTRQGVRLLRSSAGDRLDPPVPAGPFGPALGAMFTVAGLLLALLPVLGVGYVTWLVR
jgi:hypothetical protein